MAHFYGEIQGARGPASRLGGKGSGLQVKAASWQGAVHVGLYARDDGRDCARVSLIPWNGAGVSRELYDGPVDGSDAALVCPSERIATLEAALRAVIPYAQSRAEDMNESGGDACPHYLAADAAVCDAMEAIGETPIRAGDSLPSCALSMGCLCAGHARGNPVCDPCDTSEGAP